MVPIRVSGNQEIEFWVEAERPVTTFVFDEDGKDAYYEHADEDESYGGFRNRKRHHQRVMVPFRGRAYLVIVNPSKSSQSAVHYRITS